MWDQQDTSPTSLGWVTRSLAPQAHFIFLSGAFIAWPTRWNRIPLVKSSAYRSTLLLYSKITLYHELAHHLRSLVCHSCYWQDVANYLQAYGLCNNQSPEKCVDHQSKVQQHPTDRSRAIEEGGRLAEAIAFGAVVDLALSISFCHFTRLSAYLSFHSSNRRTPISCFGL